MEALVLLATVLLGTEGCTFLKGAESEKDLVGRRVVALELSSLSPEDFSVLRATPRLSALLHNSTYLPSRPRWDRHRGVVLSLNELPGESRKIFLSRVDRAADQLVKLLDPQSVLLVTGRRPSWKYRRDSEKQTDMFILDPGILMYFQSASSISKDSWTSINFVNATVDGDGVQRVVKLETQRAGHLELQFSATSQYWSLTRAVLIDADRSSREMMADCRVYAPRNASFSCRRLSLAGGSVILRNFQVQPFDVPQDGRFSSSVDCDSLACPATIMGTIVVAILLGCLSVAILAITSIRTPDRFEDAISKEAGSRLRPA